LKGTNSLFVGIESWCPKHYRLMP